MPGREVEAAPGSAFSFSMARRGRKRKEQMEILIDCLQPLAFFYGKENQTKASTYRSVNAGIIGPFTQIHVRDDGRLAAHSRVTATAGAEAANNTCLVSIHVCAEDLTNFSGGFATRF